MKFNQLRISPAALKYLSQVLSINLITPEVMLLKYNKYTLQNAYKLVTCFAGYDKIKYIHKSIP